MRFIHLADCHLDAPLVDLAKTNKANSRRREIKDTFSKVFDFAIENNVDVIFISGDLFEQKYVDKSTVQFVNSQFARIPNSMIFISPGNHDPLILNSYYSTYEWEKNVHIFKGSLEKVYLKEHNAIIWGVGFTNYYSDKSLIDEIEIDHDKLNILVCHGSLDGSINEKYHPISTNFLVKLKLDYCALGHIHKKSIDESKGICYPGSLEPLGFDEVGEHGFIVADITKEYRTLNFQTACMRKYFIKEIDITGATSIQEIIDDIKAAFNPKYYEQDVVRAMLCGEIDDVAIDVEEIEAYFKESYYHIEVHDNTTGINDFREIEKEYTLKGLFVKRMNELISKAEENDKKMLQRALNYGYDALNKRNIKL